MAIIGPSSQNFNPRGQSIQGKKPANLGVIYGPNAAVNAQRVRVAQGKKAVREYNAQVEQYNKDLAAYNAAVAEQAKLQAEINAQIEDFNRRAATGKLTFGEFQKTPFGMDLVAKYGARAGKELQQATFYDYVLSFPNIDYKAYGAANRKDLEYSRAMSYSDAIRQLKHEEKERLASMPGYKAQQQAKATLVELSKKPSLAPADIPKLNKAYQTLGVARPDYTGTITRKDGSKEIYRDGLLVNRVQSAPVQNFGVSPQQKAPVKIPVISRPSELPRTYTGAAIINAPNMKAPVIVTYQAGRITSSQPYRRP